MQNQRIAWQSLMFVFVALTFAGCDVVTSDNPLSDAKVSKAYPDLCGHWESLSKANDRIIHVVIEKNPSTDGVGFMEGRIFEEREGQFLQWWHRTFTCFCTELDGERFINICIDSERYVNIFDYEQRASCYMLLKLVPLKDWVEATKSAEAESVKSALNEEDSMVILSLSGDLTRRAIVDGKLKGGQAMQLTQLTDTSDDLCRFMRSQEGRSLFTVSGAFKRRGTVEQFYEQRKKEAALKQEQRRLEHERTVKELTERAAKLKARQAVIEAAKWRDWTIRDVKSRVHAKFERINHGICVLRLRNDELMPIKINRLSQDDQEFVLQSKWEVLAGDRLAAQEPGQNQKQAVDASLHDAIQSHLRFHAGPEHNGKRRLVVISVFMGDGRHALRYEVEEQGSSLNVRAVYSFAEVTRYDGGLTMEEGRLLRELLPKLPESNAEPGIERPIHVSFQSGDTWRTKTYNALSLPNEFKEVTEIITQPFKKTR